MAVLLVKPFFDVCLVVRENMHRVIYLNIVYV